MKSTTIDYRHALTSRAERAVDAVLDGNPDAVLSFAEHLIEEGLLGCGVEEFSLALTVAQMTERYTRTTDGTAELKAWAMAVADEIEAELAA